MNLTFTSIIQSKQYYDTLAINTIKKRKCSPNNCQKLYNILCFKVTYNKRENKLVVSL